MAKQQTQRADRSGGQRGPRASTQQTSRKQQRLRARQRQKQPWWRSPILLVVIVVVVLALVGAFIVMAQRGSSSQQAQLGQPASPDIVQAVTHVSPSVIAAVGAGALSDGTPLPNPYRAISGPALSKNGKPEVLYIGGEFCPYCAADRWSLVNALSRFGTFASLHYMRSADEDGNIATFTFHGSSYTSRYVTFTAVENEDRNRQQLQPMTAEQQRLLATLGNNSFPFVDIAGRYANDAPNAYPGGYDANVLMGKDWSQIAKALSNSRDPITQGLIGNANYLTAAICTVTHDQPASACSTSTIQTIKRRLPARP